MAYAAGRYKQMTDPDVAAVFPFWTYRHSGNPHPRLQHKAWDGLTLPLDDGFWNTNYPPNGFNCGCYVQPQMQSDLKRMGKKGPDSAPDLQTVDVVNKKTGEVRQTTKGVDPGFNYNVGKAWMEGKDGGFKQSLPRRLQAVPVAPPPPPLPDHPKRADGEKVWSEHDQSERGIELLSGKLDEKYGDWADGINRKAISTLHYYKGSGYRSINRYLRGITEYDFEKITAKMLDRALKSAPTLDRDIVLYRGVDENNPMVKAKPGKTRLYRGFISASISEKVAQDFMNRAPNGKMVVIRVPKGYKGIAYVNSVPLVQHDEYEFLARTGARYEVISHDGDTTTIELIDEGSRRARIAPPRVVASDGQK